jgi:putative FmdB family regulatory protein
MPLYEYECPACHQRFEVIRKFSDPVLEVCTLCGGGPVRRLASSPAIQFKGSGWYITDYAKKSSSDGGKGSASTPGTSSSDTSASTSTDKGTSSSGSSGSSSSGSGSSGS